MKDHSEAKAKAKDFQTSKTWCNPSLTHWEVVESIALNPLKFLLNLIKETLKPSSLEWLICTRFKSINKN